MSKAKTKSKAKAAKKAGKKHLPRRLAGIKLSKSFRRSGVAALLASPLGVAIVNDAILLAVNRLAGEARPGSRTRTFLHNRVEEIEKAGAGLVHEGADAAHAAAQTSRRLSDAASAAVEAFFGVLHAEAEMETEPAPVRRKASRAGELKAAH